jgi:transcriptional regulator with XRE-family HTH domain
MEAVDQKPMTAWVPELTELGKRIEMLRIHRGISKQHLARYAETSRQQLWRVMTGKSELTFALRARLAEALNVSVMDLDHPLPATHSITLAAPSASHDLESYLANAPAVAQTLATLPNGDTGRVLKRALLDALEDLAIAEGRTLGHEFFELRRRVVAGQL